MKGCQIEEAKLIDRLAGLAQDDRHLVALVGAPGSGKSTLARTLCAGLNGLGIPSAIVAMDGFHYDDAVLESWNLRGRKGAPETFDVAGLSALLDRLRENAGPGIAVPVFDRRLELSRNAAEVVTRDVQVVIVEGNYLLLDRPGWRDLAARFDLSVALDVPEAVLRDRLHRRWRAHAIPEDEVSAKVEGNDLPNARTVHAESRAADLVVF